MFLQVTLVRTYFLFYKTSFFLAKNKCIYIVCIYVLYVLTYPLTRRQWLVNILYFLILLLFFGLINICQVLFYEPDDFQYSVSVAFQFLLVDSQDLLFKILGYSLDKDILLGIVLAHVEFMGSCQGVNNTILIPYQLQKTNPINSWIKVILNLRLEERHLVPRHLPWQVYQRQT